MIPSIRSILGGSGPFPKLNQSNFKITSETTDDYNCIAWAAGEDDLWWWPHPDGYWPEGIQKDLTVKAFTELYEGLGYSVCKGHAYETGYEKVALFAQQNGEPTHAARQLPGGMWTSKMGRSEDIQHELHVVEGTIYGKVVKIFKRPR